MLKQDMQILVLQAFDKGLTLRSASAFASWMGLCPDNEISGGRVSWVGTRKVNCRAATSLRMAAPSLHHSKSALGDFLDSWIKDLKQEYFNN